MARPKNTIIQYERRQREFKGCKRDAAILQLEYSRYPLWSGAVFAREDYRGFADAMRLAHA